MHNAVKGEQLRIAFCSMERTLEGSVLKMVKRIQVTRTRTRTKTFQVDSPSDTLIQSFQPPEIITTISICVQSNTEGVSTKTTANERVQCSVNSNFLATSFQLGPRPTAPHSEKSIDETLIVGLGIETRVIFLP